MWVCLDIVSVCMPSRRQQLWQETLYFWVHPSHSCEDDISGASFFRFCTNVHLSSRVNRLDFCGQRSLWPYYTHSNFTNVVLNIKNDYTYYGMIHLIPFKCLHYIDVNCNLLLVETGSYEAVMLLILIESHVHLHILILGGGNVFRVKANIL